MTAIALPAVGVEDAFLGEASSTLTQGHEMENASLSPTRKQLGYLRRLAELTGTTFTPPRIRKEASREIDRMIRLLAKLVREALNDSSPLQSRAMNGVAAEETIDRAGRALIEAASSPARSCSPDLAPPPGPLRALRSGRHRVVATRGQDHNRAVPRPEGVKSRPIVRRCPTRAPHPARCIQGADHAELVRGPRPRRGTVPDPARDEHAGTPVKARELGTRGLRFRL